MDGKGEICHPPRPPLTKCARSTALLLPGAAWPALAFWERQRRASPHLERVPAPQPSTSPHPLNFHVSRWTLKGHANSTWEITTWELHLATSNFFFFGGVSVSSPLLVVPNPGPPLHPLIARLTPGLPSCLPVPTVLVCLPRQLPSRGLATTYPTTRDVQPTVEAEWRSTTRRRRHHPWRD